MKNSHFFLWKDGLSLGSPLLFVAGLDFVPVFKIIYSSLLTLFLFIYLFIHSFIHSFQLRIISVVGSHLLYLLIIFKDTELYKNGPSLGSE